MKKKKMTASVWRRGLSLLFALILAASALVLYAPAVTVTADDVSSSKVEVYHWHRIRTQDDVKDGPIIFAWGDYVSGEGFGGLKTTKYPSIGTGAEDEEFYTLGDFAFWTLKVTGTDSDNSNVKEGKLYNGAGQLVGMDIGITGTYLTKDDDDSESNTVLIATPGGPGKYCGNTPDGKIGLVFNISGDDVAIIGDGSSLDSNRTECSYTLDGYLTAFYGVKEEFSVISEPYTVRYGTTFQIKGNVVLEAELTVEDGAALSVEGALFNHAPIVNRGTFVIQEGGSVRSMTAGLKGKNGIDCIGGDLVVMNGASLIMDRDALFYMEGATAVIGGLAVFPQGISINDSHFTLVKTGYVIMGYAFNQHLGTADDIRKFVEPNGTVKAGELQKKRLERIKKTMETVKKDAFPGVFSGENVMKGFTDENFIVSKGTKPGGDTKWVE